MRSQIVWTVSHYASDDESRGIVGVFSTEEAALMAANAEAQEWPSVGSGLVVFDIEEDHPLRDVLGNDVHGVAYQAEMDGVTQTLMVRPWALKP